MKLNKTLLIACASFVIAGIITFSILDGVYKRKVNKIKESYTVQNEQIAFERDSLKVHADSIDFVVALYKSRNDSLEVNDGLHRVEIDDLKLRLRTVLNDMWDQYLNDNGLYAYDYLQGRYLSKDTLDYLFSGEQVLYMATDIIKGDYLDSLLTMEQNRILGLKNQVVNYKGMVSTLEKDRDEFKFLTDKLYDKLATKIEELQLSEEEIAELKNKLLKTRLAGGGIGLGLLALLILL